jgi:hypothetical protein
MQRSRGSGRQEPSSCQSCRIKKLRCNRCQPCSNCSNRGIGCVFLIPPQAQAANGSDSDNNADLIQRIARLEEFLQQVSRGSIDPQSGDLETSKFVEVPDLAPDDLVHNTFLDAERDTWYLENIGTREDSLVRDKRYFFQLITFLTPHLVEQPLQQLCLDIAQYKGHSSRRHRH